LVMPQLPSGSDQEEALTTAAKRSNSVAALELHHRQQRQRPCRALLSLLLIALRSLQ
jgi:hypothetical protein